MNELLTKINNAVIGERTQLTTPFGTKPLVYADYTASGRALDFVEHYINTSVLPFYANTHSESSFTGRQSTLLRESARRAIKKSVGAGEDHAVVFCGSGATTGINKLIRLLGLDQPCVPTQQPVVFIGPYEHHSNELPWRESCAEVVTIPLDSLGHIDVAVLEKKLAQYQDRPLKITSFSAASNVTGIISPVASITALVHRYGFLSFWDYAAGGPYLPINVSGASHDDYIDAAFISPHKFIGGPGTPGVLVVRKSMITATSPAMPGGGTVSFVAPNRHRYIECIERREEGGTPAIVESIRAGVVFDLKDRVGTDTIHARETEHLNRAFAKWRHNENIDILGGTEAERLSIVSLRITHDDRDLHYGFVVAALNDVFGIQARGGCSCAGPYGHSLLGISESESEAIEAANLAGDMVLRPGWVRLNFNYFLDDETVDYLIDAIDWIANHGVRLLPYYQFDVSSGTWNFLGQRVEMPVNLSDYLDGNVSAEKVELDFQGCVDAVVRCLTDITATPRDVELKSESSVLRWFIQPSEAI